VGWVTWLSAAIEAPGIIGSTASFAASRLANSAANRPRGLKAVGERASSVGATVELSDII